MLNSRLRFYGPIRDDYEITEFSSIGQYLYELAKSHDVLNFIETGSSTGGSSRCIASGLKDSDGKLYTFEASKNRFKLLVDNLRDLPVVPINESTLPTDGIQSYYASENSEFAECKHTFENLLRSINFDACFLDSINLCQAQECELAVRYKIRNILMHEPDHKCQYYDWPLRCNGYQLINASRDEINRFDGCDTKAHPQPLWVHYKNTGFPDEGCL